MKTVSDMSTLVDGFDKHLSEYHITARSRTLSIPYDAKPKDNLLAAIQEIITERDDALKKLREHVCEIPTSLDY